VGGYRGGPYCRGVDVGAAKGRHLIGKGDVLAGDECSGNLCSLHGVEFSGGRIAWPGLLKDGRS